MPAQGYDFSLTVGDTTRGFMVAKDENNRKIWRVGLAPALAPQQRLSASNLYAGAPPEINSIFAAERWGDGAGYRDSVIQEDCLCTRYPYSRGVDLSYTLRGYLSPKRLARRQDSGVALSAAPGYIESTTLGVLMYAGAYIYRWDSTTDVWIEVDDASGDGEDYRGKITEKDGTVYIARGAGAAYKYSTNGTTWTASNRTTNDALADDFTTRGDDGTNLNTIVRLRSGRVSVSTDGINSGTAWSSEDTIGSTSETSKFIIAVDDALYIYKKEGIYRYDFVNVDDLWITEYLQDDNADYLYWGSDGLLYANYGDRILQFDPQQNLFKYVFPLIDMDDTEIKGSITGLTGDDFNMYLSVQNAKGNTYIIKGNPGEAWHTIAYPVTDNTVDTTEDTATMRVLGPGTIHAENPVLVTGYGATDTVHYILPRANLRPEDDPNCLFEDVPGLSGAFVVGPWVDFGAAAYTKFLNRGTLLGENLSASRTLVLGYQLPGAAAVSIITADYDGFTSAEVSSAIELNRVRYKLTMTTGDSGSTPILIGLTLQSTLNSPRFRVWNIVVALAPEIEINDNVRDFWQDSDELEDFLFTAVTQRVTLTDRRDRQYLVKLNEFDGIDMTNYQMGGDYRDALLYQLQLVEIAALSTSTSPLIYNQDNWNSGKVWS